MMKFGKYYNSPIWYVVIRAATSIQVVDGPYYKHCQALLGMVEYGRQNPKSGELTVADIRFPSDIMECE